MKRFADIHTHNLLAGPEAVICIDPVDPDCAPLRPDRFYSVGIHPWNAAMPDVAPAWERLKEMAAQSNVVAIGETGFDKLRGPALQQQRALFIRHAQLAESLGKPLVIHCVGCWQELIASRRSIRPSVPWIVHGFRGKPQLARQLLDAGFDISLGSRFNPLTEAVIPPARLYRETD